MRTILSVSGKLESTFAMTEWNIARKLNDTNWNGEEDEESVCVINQLNSFETGELSDIN